MTSIDCYRECQYEYNNPSADAKNVLNNLSETSNQYQYTGTEFTIVNE